MAETECKNLRALVTSASTAQPLTSVYLGDNQTLVVPFTLDYVNINLHYCNEPEIKGWVDCTGPTCLLCKIGRKVEERLLTPVYMPVGNCVSVLMMSPLMRPGALLPQFVDHVDKAEEAGAKLAMFIKRHSDKQSYDVKSRHLQAGENDGAATVKQFLNGVANWNATLSSVVQHLSDAQLRAVRSISDELAWREGGLG